MSDVYISKGSTKERIDPSTENKQRDIETRLEELKLLVQDQVDVMAASTVAGETQRLTNGTANTDGSVGVLPGKTYVFTSLVTGGFYFSLVDTQVAGNVRWVCPLYQTILFKIPADGYVLHYATDTTSGIGYLRRVE